MESLTELLVQIIEESKIENYLLYGSLAYQLYTHDQITINDIDIIISKTDFDKVRKNLKNDPNYQVFPFEKTIHVNLANEIGTDGKPFDISFDSFEDYFFDLGIKLDEYQLFMISGRQLKVIPIKQLLNIYKSTVADHAKKLQYQKTIRVLEKFIMRNAN